MRSSAKAKHFGYRECGSECTETDSIQQWSLVGSRFQIFYRFCIVSAKPQLKAILSEVNIPFQIIQTLLIRAVTHNSGFP